MLHAWDIYGLEKATIEYFRLYDNKHRNPNYDFPSFKKIVEEKIEFLGMVKGTKNRQYRQFKDTHRRLSRRDKGVPFTRMPLTIESKLTLYTEGPTDAIILETAWRKLYDDEKPLFRILPIEIKPGFGTGADALVDAINSHREEHGIAIAIFDNDTKGIQAYNKLHKNEFVEVDNSFKVCKERKAAAFLLPVPEGKEKIAQLEKLWIENYFSETALNSKTDDGNGLTFEYKPRVHKEMIGNKIGCIQML